ncbi:MAG: DUF3375 family protein [Planctomycetaceae bacterium]
MSFDAFMKLLFSQVQQEELENLIQQLDEIAELAGHEEGKDRLRGMIRHLSQEADKVMQTLRRLNTTLRRLLSSRVSKSRMRLVTTLNEIKEAAMQQAEEPPAEIGFELFVDLDLNNAMQRTFWQAPVAFEELTFAEDEPDELERQKAFEHLAAMQRLDWEVMRHNINSLVEFEEERTLPDLIDHCGLQNGTIEILGYIQLAHDEGHIVDEAVQETILIPTREGMQHFEVPRVVFLSERQRLFRSLSSAGEESA